MSPLGRIAWQDVESSNIQSVFYHDRTKTICVRFLNGGLYSYIGADYDIYMNLVHAPSVGKYLHFVVKALPFTRWDSEAELIEHLNV